jgi:biotin synthase-like enzyme
MTATTGVTSAGKCGYCNVEIRGDEGIIVDVRAQMQKVAEDAKTLSKSKLLQLSREGTCGFGHKKMRRALVRALRGSCGGC